MKSMTNDVECCNEQPMISLQTNTTGNADTYQIECMDSGWKGSGSKLFTKVSTTSSDTAEVTVSTVRNHPNESSLSSSLTSRHVDTTNPITNDINDDESLLLDTPLPDEIPRYIYARLRHNHITAANIATRSSIPVPHEVSEWNPNTSTTSTISPLSSSHPTSKSIVQRWFRRRRPIVSPTSVNAPNGTPTSQQQAQQQDEEYETRMIRHMQLMIYNDESDNQSELVGSGMTLVSL